MVSAMRSSCAHHRVMIRAFKGDPGHRVLLGINEGTSRPTASDCAERSSCARTHDARALFQGRGSGLGPGCMPRLPRCSYQGRPCCTPLKVLCHTCTGLSAAVNRSRNPSPYTHRATCAAVCCHLICTSRHGAGRLFSPRCYICCTKRYIYSAWCHFCLRDTPGRGQYPTAGRRWKRSPR